MIQKLYKCRECGKEFSYPMDSKEYECCGIVYTEPREKVDLKKLVNEDENMPKETKEALNRIM